MPTGGRKLARRPPIYGRRLTGPPFQGGGGGGGRKLAKVDLPNSGPGNVMSKSA